MHLGTPNYFPDNFGRTSFYDETRLCGTVETSRSSSQWAAPEPRRSETIFGIVVSVVLIFTGLFAKSAPSAIRPGVELHA